MDKPANIYSPVYCDDGVSPHFLTHSPESMARFRSRFIDVVQKDSPGKTFGFSTAMQATKCFDIDAAVKSLGGQNPSSMDCIIKIGNYDAVHQRFSNQRWLLVELKLNMTDDRNDHKELLRKVTDTESGLAGESIDLSRNFIYTEFLYPRRRKRFNDWKKGTNGTEYRNWECFSPSRFEKFLQFMENLPYIPENAVEAIRNSVLAATDLYSFDAKMRDWLRLAENYKITGNKYEYHHILSCLNKLLQEYCRALEPSDNKELLLEEWSFLKKFY